MRTTRRGKVTVAIVLVGIVMGLVAGRRSLDAVVAPLVVALVAARFRLGRLERPTMERLVPENGFVGETRTVGLSFDAERPLAATVGETVDDGLAATGSTVETVLSGESVLEYEVDLEERGERTLGPTTVTVQDLLGLFERTIEYDDTDTVLAYPRVFELTGGRRHELNLVVDDALAHRREEFDRLREYARGDSLRDVHWKSSAKRPEEETLVVKEFVAEEEAGSATILAEAGEGGADYMAEATASIALYLLDAGIDVGVSAPNGSVPVGAGADHRVDILSLLARAGPGEATATATSSDLLVYGDASGATVELPETDLPFDDLAGVELGTRGGYDPAGVAGTGVPG